MSRTFIPVPGLEDVIDHSDDRSMLPYEISKALLAACRERPDSAGALLMELYFPAELPPQARKKRIMRLGERFDLPYNEQYLTAYVTNEAAFHAATAENRCIRYAPKGLRHLIREAAEWEYSVRFVTVRRSVLVPWSYFDDIRYFLNEEADIRTAKEDPRPDADEEMVNVCAKGPESENAEKTDCRSVSDGE